MVTQLLSDLRALGFTVKTDGFELEIRGPVESMSPDLRRRITANRDALIALVADTMPARSILFSIAKKAVVGTGIDPSELTQWLINQDDPGWCTPKAVRRWAEIIRDRGWPEDKETHSSKKEQLNVCRTN